MPEGSAGAVSIHCHHLSVSDVGIPARLQPLSLQLEPGDRLLVQGPSGSGKSTLIHALLGFLPYQGELLINGQPLHSLDRSAWHARVSYLAQQPELLPGSVADNLRLAAPQATDVRLIHVLQEVGLWELLRRLPLQLNTPLGERGLGLSRGQLSRLALARLLLRDTPVWRSEEHTSELQSRPHLVCRLLLEKKKKNYTT